MTDKKVLEDRIDPMPSIYINYHERCGHIEEVKPIANNRSGDSKFRCPDCGTPLKYSHENSESLSFYCPNCKHLVAARYLFDAIVEAMKKRRGLNEL